MKKLFLIILLFSLSCNKDSSSTSDQKVASQSGDDNTSVVDDSNSPDGDNNYGGDYGGNYGGTTGSYSGGSGDGDNDSGSGTDTSTTKSWTEEFVDLVNAHRSSIGLRTLIHNDGMADIARGHSEDMASGRVAFGHTGFSARCSEARSVLGGGNWCAENVAAGQKTPQAAFTSWMNSSGHRANIESSKATHMGFGYAKNSSGKYYWTQIFLQN